MAEWTKDSGYGFVELVVAPCCGFTFDAGHEDEDGGYSCPACAEIKLRAAIDEIAGLMEAAVRVSREHGYSGSIFAAAVEDWSIRLRAAIGKDDK